MKIQTVLKPLLVALIGLPVASVQAINWDGGGDNNLWSNPTNWVGDNVPDNNTESAAFVGGANVAINVDTNFTIQSYVDGFGGEGFTNTLYGGGTLAIDRNKNGWPAILNATGNGGGVLRLNGGIVITNSAGGNTLVRNDNSSGNTTLFDTNSKLTLATVLQTMNGAGGTIRFNGQLLASSANLVIGSDNVSFGIGHNSSSFGRDIVLSGGGKLAVDGGIVLAPFRKFQINGNAEIELNATNSVNGANFVVALGNNLVVDANSNQDDLGFLKFDSGTVTLDLDGGLTGMSFSDSSSQVWGSGSLVISNFMTEVVQFGTSSNGLAASQLSQTTAYDATGAVVADLGINGSGFLTGTVASGPGPVEVGDVGIGLVNGGSAVALSWGSTNGASYGVSNTANLVLGPWVLLTNGLAGNGGILAFTNATGQAEDFYIVFSE